MIQNKVARIIHHEERLAHTNCLFQQMHSLKFQDLVKYRTAITILFRHLWWNYTAQSFHKLKVAFNNAFRMMHNLPTYCSASEMFTVNRVADCKAVIRNLVHRFMMRLMISKHLLVCSILSSDVVCSSRIRRHWARLLYVHYHGG